MRLDVKITDDQGRLYDCEMQTANEYNLGKRMRYYQGMLNAQYGLKKGKTYNDELRPKN